MSFLFQRKLNAHSKMQNCLVQQQQGGRGMLSRDQGLRQVPATESGCVSTSDSELKDGTQPAGAEYLNSRCVLFTYFQGDISDVVDEHFSRALSQSSTFSSETKPIRMTQPSVSSIAGSWKGEICLNYTRPDSLIWFYFTANSFYPQLNWLAVDKKRKNVAVCWSKVFVFQMVCLSLRVRAAQFGTAPIHPRPVPASHLSPSQSIQTSLPALFPSTTRMELCGPAMCSPRPASRLWRPSLTAGPTAWTPKAQAATPMFMTSIILTPMHTSTPGTTTPCSIPTRPTVQH